MNKGERLTQEQENELLQMLADGRSTKEIMAHFDIGRSAVYRRRRFSFPERLYQRNDSYKVKDDAQANDGLKSLYDYTPEERKAIDDEIDACIETDPFA